MKAAVFSGEGAKIGIQAYILRDLTSNGYDPDILIGCSSGALVAAGYSLLGADGLCDLIKSIKSFKDVFSFDWKFIISGGLFTTKPLEKKIYQATQMKSFTKDVWFPVTEASSGLMAWVPCFKDRPFKKTCLSELMDAVTIPGLIVPATGYVDGGVSVLCPVEKAIAQGATEVAVVLGRPLYSIPHFTPWRWFGFASYGYRFLDLLMHNLLLSDIEKCLVKYPKVKINIYHPHIPVGDALDFDKCRLMLSGNIRYAMFDSEEWGKHEEIN